jgi:hypothetical protein
MLPRPRITALAVRRGPAAEDEELAVEAERS